MGVCCCKKKQEPIDFLKNSPLGQCTNQTLAKIVKYLDVETFSEGTELYSSNDTPVRKIYFIVDGVVEYIWNSQSWFLNEKNALGFEFLKVAGDPIRMTVKANTKVKAYTITIASLDEVLAKCDEYDRTYFYDTFPLHVKLKQIHLFQTLEEEELKLLAAVSSYQTIVKEDILVQEGVSDTCLHVVLEGGLQSEATRTTLHRMTMHDDTSSGLINTPMTSEGGRENLNSEMVVSDDKGAHSPRSPNHPKRVISNIGKGQSTGAAYFMTQMPHLTSLVAESNSLILSISKEHFEPFVENHANITRILEYDCGRQIARALRKFDVPFFKVFSQDILTEFAQTAKILQYDRDEVIMREGDMGTTFYILISG
jgi:CRP-like cAMP-binding protein